MNALDIAQQIKGAAIGDTIVVDSETQKELAEIAIARMRPDDGLKIEVREKE